MRRIYGQDAPQASNAVQININLRRTALDVVGDTAEAEIVKTK
jgi:hypothetical protein